MSLPVDKVLRKAQSHLKAGETTEAEELYKQVLSKFPKNKKAIQGYQKLKAGNNGHEAINIDPPQGDVQVLIDLYNQGQFEKVLSKAKITGSVHFGENCIVHDFCEIIDEGGGI